MLKRGGFTFQLVNYVFTTRKSLMPLLCREMISLSQQVGEDSG